MRSSVLVAIAVATLSIGAPRLALAQQTSEDEIVSATNRYFSGELDEAAVFLGVGAGSAFIAGSIAGTHGSFGIGAACGILPVSAIQLGAGIVLLVRTRGQVADLLGLYRKDRRAHSKEETSRMERVSRGFDIYMGIEIGLIALGGGSIAFGAVDDRDGFIGAGVGLAAQASAMLVLDLVASRRASVYLDVLRRHAPPARGAREEPRTGVAVFPVVSPGGAGLAGSF